MAVVVDVKIRIVATQIKETLKIRWLSSYDSFPNFLVTLHINHSSGIVLFFWFFFNFYFSIL